MPSYDYRCIDETCNVVQEFIQSIHKPLPESLSCPKCGNDAFHVFLVAPGVLTSGMSHNTLDVAIGKDAEARWERVHERTAQRNKIRQEAGKTGLTKVGANQYEANDKKLTQMKAPEPKED